MESEKMMGKFYCQNICVAVDFNIDEWNKAAEYCDQAGLSEADTNKVLEGEPCGKQCFACMAIVGATREKNSKLPALEGPLTSNDLDSRSDDNKQKNHERKRKTNPTNSRNSSSR